MGSTELNEDDSLHVCTFNKDFTRLERFFKIEILLKNCSLHELYISQKKKDGHLSELLFSRRSHGREINIE